MRRRAEAATVVVRPSVMTPDVVLFCVFVSLPSSLGYWTCPRLAQRVGLARLRRPAVLRLAVGVCRSAPLQLLTCHSHVARTVFPLSRCPNHATEP